MTVTKTSDTVEVDGVKIYYEKYGTGPKIVLMIPGALGTTDIEFSGQFKSLTNANLTLIAVDPPGYGRSRPPDKLYPIDADLNAEWYKQDAELYYKFMKDHLSIDQYSIMGFSDGGRVGIHVASSHPEVVDRMVIWGVSMTLTEKEVAFLKGFKDISKWGPERRRTFKCYGDKLGQMWGDWIDAISTAKILVPQDAVKDVKCKTMILHGETDYIVGVGHAIKLKSLIKGSRLITLKANHNCHIEKHIEFDRIVLNFFSD